jgi:prolyl-tRNA synthetase
MFSDADLFGIPLRVIVSPRNQLNGEVEIVTRDRAVRKMVAIRDATEAVRFMAAKLE